MRPTSSTQNYLMPRQITTVLLGMLTGLIIHLYLILSEEFILSEINASGIIGAMLLGIVLAFTIRFISDKLNDVIKWEDNAGGRLLASLLITTSIVGLCFYVFYNLIWPHVVSVPREDITLSMITCIKLMILIFVLALIYTILSYVHYSYQAVAFAQVNRIQLKREIIDIQMETLKSQLRPHFLFNSLNTISSLIHSNRDDAELFIRRLAETYNYTLENYKKESITLKEEIGLVTSYVAMMRARFGDNVILLNNVPSELLSKNVLPLSLQTLIENALKHNVINDEHQLTISLEANEDFVRIENNKTISPSAVISNNIGLANLQKRYRLWDDQKVSIKNHEHSFAVTIPIS